ncbi:MAG: crotonase/enoyl-CoA hydratase family protein, partial [Pseudomonadota bacterium]
MSATIDIQDKVAVIKMDDGKANAINPTMLDALHACLDDAEANADAVVITGRENRFSGGFDLRMMSSAPPEDVRALVTNGGKLAMRLYGFKLPVVAACTGHGVAMGSFILLSCDFRVGARGEFKLGANETAIHMVLPKFAAELIKARIDPRRLTEAGVTGQLFNPD